MILLSGHFYSIIEVSFICKCFLKKVEKKVGFFIFGDKMREKVLIEWLGTRKIQFISDKL